MTNDGAAGAGSWEQQLAGAFEILLGRPLSSYSANAVYAAYFDGNWFSEGGFDQAADWVDPAALAGREKVAFDDLQLYHQGEAPLRFDASESLFEILDADDGPAGTIDDLAGLPAAAAQDLIAAFLPAEGLVRGQDLAAVLDRHRIDVAALNWYVAYPRIASDGTLIDAMRVATGIGDGPETLAAVKVEAGSTIVRTEETWSEAEERWAEGLATVTPVELRNHLLLGCLERGSAAIGLTYLEATGVSGGDPVLPDDDCELLACWDEEQNQREVNVVKLSDAVAGQRSHPNR